MRTYYNSKNIIVHSIEVSHIAHKFLLLSLTHSTQVLFGPIQIHFSNHWTKQQLSHHGKHSCWCLLWEVHHPNFHLIHHPNFHAQTALGYSFHPHHTEQKSLSLILLSRMKLWRAMHATIILACLRVWNFGIFNSILNFIFKTPKDRSMTFLIRECAWLNVSFIPAGGGPFCQCSTWYLVHRYGDR